MKTVFILGAGSSVESGYPWGKGLKDIILSLLNPRNDWRKVLRDAGNSDENIADFAQRLQLADYDTIDEFMEELHALEHIRSVGRQALAIAIATHESGQLFNKSLNDGSWFRVFRNHLGKNRGQAISSKYFSFITFNYDVALEHYLYTAIHSGSPRADIGTILREDFLGPSNFIHLHGRVGTLEWMNASRDIIPRPFGAQITAETLKGTGTELLFPHQDLNTGSIRDLLFSAETIVILGFGFHPYNLKRIFFDELVERPNARIFATTFGLGAESLARLKQHSGVRTFQLPCKQFMKEFFERVDNNTLDKWNNVPSVQLVSIHTSKRTDLDGL